MNKFIKKLGIMILAISLVTLCLVSFVACNDVDTDAKTVTITIGETAYTLETSAAFLHEGLLELKENGEIVKYDFSDSEYGIFVNELSDLDLSAENSFISVFHNIDDASLIDYSDWAGKDITLDGVVYKPAFVGVADLPLQDGAKYLLTVSAF